MCLHHTRDWPRNLAPGCVTPVADANDIGAACRNIRFPSARNAQHHTSADSLVTRLGCQSRLCHPVLARLDHPHSRIVGST